MTDNDIVKALECLGGQDMACKDCPFDVQNYHICSSNVARNARMLILKQQAEIERLKKNNGERVDFLSKLIKAEKKKCKWSVGTAEIEAIKEFARRVKETFPPREDPHCTDDDIFTLDSIDQIMNEMFGIIVENPVESVENRAIFHR